MRKNEELIYDFDDSRIPPMLKDDINKMIHKHDDNITKIVISLRCDKLLCFHDKNHYCSKCDKFIVTSSVMRFSILNPCGHIKNEINKNAANYKINVNKFFLDNFALKQFQLTDYNNLKEKSNNKEWNN